VALDPSADMAVFDFKGAADWRMFRKLAVRFALGRRPATLSALHDYLVEVQHEVNRRTEIIGDLDFDRCPEGQITRSLAEDEELGMRPLFIFIDEAHRAFQDPTWGQKITDLVEDIAKNAPFVGVVLVVMTQKPDSKAVPTRVRDVLGTRAAGKCMTRQSSEAILGTEAYSEGYNAAALPKRKGIFMLYGAEDSSGIFDASTVRVDLCDVAHASMVAERATAAREKVDRLPTATGGDETPADDPVPTLLVCAQQIQGEREWVASEEVLAQMNEQPEYAGSPWNATNLGRALRRLGYPSYSESALRGRRAFNFRAEPYFPEREKATGTDGVIVLGGRRTPAPRRPR
jgi:S-DNA-T family DNA segregation ATPase FtsK/SpoIIIE